MLRRFLLTVLLGCTLFALSSLANTPESVTGPSRSMELLRGWEIQSSCEAKDPGVLFQVACAYALCGPAVVHGKAPEAITTADREQQQRYATQAVEALRQAKANGYKSVHELLTDPDLDPLRQDERFKQFLLEYGSTPAGPKP